MRHIVAAAAIIAGFAWPQARTSIPLVDLASDTSRQVVMDREDGQYLGHVTTVLGRQSKPERDERLLRRGPGSFLQPTESAPATPRPPRSGSRSSAR